MKTIARPSYLNKLVNLRHNGMIKVVTGIRRCGKSFLLSQIFCDYLKENGVRSDHIINIDLDDFRNRRLRNPDAMFDFIESEIKDAGWHYVMIDEVQMLQDFEDVLNGLMKISNLDLYVTGSNAKFLSKDIVTEFRGRGYEIKMYPLSFEEFMTVFSGSNQAGFREYMLYGGLPQVVSLPTEEMKSEFLKRLFNETYIRDIKERHNIRKDDDLEELINILASNIGALSNPNKLADTFRSVKHSEISYDTVKEYTDYLCDSFLIEKVTRYDIKGNRYVNAPFKYYFMDLGLRNARLNFRQSEWTHLMENLVYNELMVRGFNVDVGIVPTVLRNKEGRQQRANFEVDFVCNKGSRRYYIQSAYRLDSDEKIQQEKASLKKIGDSFRKIIILGEETPVLRDENGITTMSIYDFLLNPNSLDL